MKSLRREFVTLLFAIAISEIAVLLYPLLKQIEQQHQASIPSLGHLLLMMIVIAASWVGWQKSGAGENRDVNTVWEMNFILLIIDVAIVIVYFAIVKSLDQGTSQLTFHETVGISIVFAGYLIWDLLVLRGADTTTKLLPIISFVCLLLALVAAFLLHAIQTDRGIVLCQLSLLGLVLLFRAWQEAVVATKADSAGRILMGLQNWRSLVSLLLYLVAGAAAWRTG